MYQFSVPEGFRCTGRSGSPTSPTCVICWDPPKSMYKRASLLGAGDNVNDSAETVTIRFV